MTLKVVPLSTSIDNDKKSVIETLEDALEQARDGLIQSVSIAVVRPNGALNTGWSDNENGVGAQLGAVLLLQHRLMKQLEEDTE